MNCCSARQARECRRASASTPSAVNGRNLKATWAATLRALRRGKRSVWSYSEEQIDVTQTVELVPGPQSGRLDTCLVRYRIDNRDRRPHTVGLRFLLDTFIGANDGVPFLIPGRNQLCDTRLDVQGRDVPLYIQACESDDLAHPGTIARIQFVLGGALTPPDRVTLGAWPNAELAHLMRDRRCRQQETLWEVPVYDISLLHDSAVAMYWNPQSFSAGRESGNGLQLRPRRRGGRRGRRQARPERRWFVHAGRRVKRHGLCEQSGARPDGDVNASRGISNYRRRRPDAAGARVGFHFRQSAESGDVDGQGGRGGRLHDQGGVEQRRGSVQESDHQNEKPVWRQLSLYPTMSFRWFIYYCAVCGGCAALVGWTLGKFPSLSPGVLLDAFKALCVGLMLGAVLALIDSLVNFSWGRVFVIASRVLTAGLVGAAAGFVGGLITGGATRDLNVLPLQTAAQILGWTLTGLLIGASVGVFDLLLALLRKYDMRARCGKSSTDYRAAPSAACWAAYSIYSFTER